MLTDQGFYQYSYDPYLIKGHPLAPDVGAWIFNRGQGRIVPDLTGNKRNCTLGTSITWKNKPIAEGGGWCAKFVNGNYDQSGLLPIWKNFSLPVTVTAILKAPTASVDVKGVFSSSHFNAYYSGLWVAIWDTNIVGASIGDNTGNTASDRRSRSSAISLTAGKIYVVTCVFVSITDIDIYINGVLQNGVLSGTGGDMAFNPLTGGAKIGYAPNTISNTGYTSDIHAVYVYNRELTPNQIAWQAMDPYAPFIQANTYQQFAQGILAAALPRTYIVGTIFG